MTSEDLPRRKKIRLEGYDYSANGLYFVTICVTKKIPSPVGECRGEQCSPADCK